MPHTEPGGEVVNLYGRAVGANEKVPKALRHDHLSGTKGIFNARALRTGEGPLFVCEGPFDALSLIAAGYPRAAAMFGVDGWRWSWAREIREIVFALDADKAGESWRELARQAVLRGKQVAYLSPEAYGGHKDASEAWQAGVLRVGAWPKPGEPEPESADALIKRQGWALIESTVLGEQVMLAKDGEAARQAPVGFAVYTLAEAELLGTNSQAWRAVHKVKRLIGGAVTEVRRTPTSQEVLAHSKC
ncbi:MAG: toprim domain-containing protein [Firmicutes bacterium]|nr:toprim domain-containing protein [Bacillota bacterium]